MSAKLMGLVFELEVERDEFPVLIALADHAHDDGTSVYPSVGYLAWKTNLSERSVQRILRKLEDRGLIESTGGTSGGRGITREFVLHLSNGVKKSPYDKRKGGKTSPYPKRVKDDTTSPIEAERVTPVTGKGDIHDIKRVTPVTPPIKVLEPSVLEPSVEPSTTGGRARDEHWDALVEVFGFSPTKKTPEHGKWVAALKTIRAIGITGDEVIRAADLYREQHPDAAFTVNAVANNAERLLRTRPRERPAQITDIKNPMVRAALTTDLSSVRAEMEAERDSRRALRDEDYRPRQLPQSTRRLSAGE